MKTAGRYRDRCEFIGACDGGSSAPMNAERPLGVDPLGLGQNAKASARSSCSEGPNRRWLTLTQASNAPL